MFQKNSSQRISNQLSNFRREIQIDFGSHLESLEEIFENDKFEILDLQFYETGREQTYSFTSKK